MAILMLIGSDQVNEPYQYLNDVIGVFEDDYPFTDNELARFQFLTVNGSRIDVETRLKQLTPIVGVASLVENKWEFLEVQPPDVVQKRVWSIDDGKNWYDLVTDFKFPINIGELTAEEKQLLETVDINHPSVDLAIRKTIKDLVAANPDNDTIERDLKGTMPF